MIPANSNDFLVDTESVNSGKKTAATVQAKRRRVLQLVDNCKTQLQDGYNKQRLAYVFEVIKYAKTRGLLGATRHDDICAATEINIANNILRSGRWEEIEIGATTEGSTALYVYISLVAVGLIPA